MSRIIAIALLVACVSAANWSQWGGEGLDNSHANMHETTINRHTVANLRPIWVKTVDGDVSCTPTVRGGAVYFMDWNGTAWAVRESDGATIWKINLSNLLGTAKKLVSRTSPTLTQKAVIFGIQGPAYVVALDRATGRMLWHRLVETHLAAIITGSIRLFENRLYVPISSREEEIAAFIPHYNCCSFRVAW